MCIRGAGGAVLYWGVSIASMDLPIEAYRGLPMKFRTMAAAAMIGLASLGASAQQPAGGGGGGGIGGGDGGLGLGAIQDESTPKELPRPPIARKSDPKPPLLWNFGAFVLILAAVFGANMIPSKRGHQD